MSVKPNSPENDKVAGLLLGIIDREGGYVNHPADKGGPTKYGITLKTLKSHRERTQKRTADVDDVKRLTRTEAFNIYYRDFYSGVKIDTLPEGIQEIVTDMAVNHGPRNAILMLQDVLKTCGVQVGELDGICGPKTRKASEMLWNRIGKDFVHALVARRKEFYRAVVENDPSQKVFKSGWMTRADSFLT